MLQDLRFALRVLRRSPGFVAAGVVTLAIGIGATTAIFTLVDAVLLRPLDVPASDRVVLFQQATQYGTATTFQYTAALNWKAGLKDAGLLAVESMDRIRVDSLAGVEQRFAGFVSADYFDVVGRPPVRGRAFTAMDDRPGAEPVVIVGHDYWRSALSADERVLGRVVRIDGVSFTVVGVAAPGVRGTNLSRPVDVFLPAHAILRTTTLGPGSGNYYFQDGTPGWSPSAWWRVIVRLSDSVTREAFAARVSADRIDPVPVQTAAVEPRVRGPVSAFSTMLFVAVMLVLSIGCANLAGLTMARTEARRRDVAIRLAVGISRARLVRQLLIECLVIAVAGGAAGVVLTRGLLAGVATFELPGFVPLGTLAYPLDARILGFALVLTVTVAVAFGVAPARMAAKVQMFELMKDGARGYRAAFARHVLIAAQVAITTVLLCGAGLFVRSLQVALGVDVGTDTNRLVVADVDLASARYTPLQQAAYYEAATSRLGNVPGVTSVSWGTGPFINAGTSTPVVVVDGQSLRLPKNVKEFEAGPEYFRTLGLRLTRGRDFTSADVRGRGSVVVVNEAFARRFWDSADPIGHRVSLRPFVVDAAVVGVVADGKYNSLTEQGTLAVFHPWSSIGGSRSQGAFMVRAAASARALTAPVRAELAGVDRGVLVTKIGLLTDRIGQLMTPQRLGSWLLSGFALVGLLLGMIGIHALLSYMIAQRTHEIGVRMALGARARDVTRLVVRGVGIAIASGAAVGGVASWWLARLAGGLLFGVTEHDPRAFGTAFALLLVAAVAGCTIPARRATRVDPMIALRTE